MINTPENINIFIAYAAEDLPILEELKVHLSVLERLNMVDQIWYNGMVEAGENWEERVLDALHNADIILILVSADFIASDFAYNQEMLQAIKLHEEGKVTSLPIIVRPCIWEPTPFSRLQVLPKNKRPISSKDWKHEDEPYVEIVEAVEKAIVSIKKKAIGEDVQKYHSEFSRSIEEAAHYFAAGKWAEAQARYQQALHFTDKETAEEITAIQRKIEDCKKEIYFQRNFLRGESAYKKNDYTSAQSFFAQALVFKPSNEEAQKLKAAADLGVNGKGKIEQENKTTKMPRFLQVKIFGFEIFKLVITFSLIGLILIPLVNQWNKDVIIIAEVTPGGTIFTNESGGEVLRTSFVDGKNPSKALAAVKDKDGKWGYIDLEANQKIDFVYDEAWPHSSEGLAYVKQGEKCGFIDVDGQVKIPLIYLDAASFSEGLAMVKKGEKYYAFIDKNGREIISQLEKVLTPVFKNGEAVVVRNGKKMTIDKEGKCIDACREIGDYDWNEQQREKAIKTLLKQKDILLEDGEYERALMKLEELQKLSLEEKEKFTWDNQIDLLRRKINDQEKALYQKLLKEADPLFRKGDFINAQKIYKKALELDLIFTEEAKAKYGLCEEYLKAESNQTASLYGFQHPSGLWGIKNAQQEVVIAPKYDSVGVLANGFIAVQEEGLWGFLDEEVNVAVKPFYNKVDTFSKEGFSKVGKEGEEIRIDRRGRKSLPLERQ